MEGPVTAGNLPVVYFRALQDPKKIPRQANLTEPNEGFTNHNQSTDIMTRVPQLSLGAKEEGAKKEVVSQ